MQKRTHPKFRRPNYGRSSRSRIKIAWRRPRGIDNKKRLKIKYMGASPSIGYGQPSEIKHNHPQGLPEMLVQTPAQLANLKDVVVRIAGGVGRKKREEIIKLAESMKLRVVNKAKKYAPKIIKEKKVETKKEEPKKIEEKKAEAPKTNEPDKVEAPKKAEIPKPAAPQTKQ
ncbi:MAG: eL32 family ribosomal protein [Candidatus Anstonellaceae archaeon]